MTDQKEGIENYDLIAHIEADLEDLVPGYIEGRRKDVARIIACLKDDDFESIGVLGHTMKGTGGGYGFNAITNLGKSIEIAAKEGNHKEISRLTDELKAYLDQVKIVYE